MSDRNGKSPFAEIMVQGWVKLPRWILNSPVFANSELLRVYIWCLLKACHSPQHFLMPTGKGMTEVSLQPGQLLYGREKSAMDLALKPSTLRNLIAKLEKYGLIKIDPRSHYSVITVTTFEFGIPKSAAKPEEANENGQVEDRQRTGKGRAKDTSKNEENAKNEKTPPHTPPNGSCTQAAWAVVGEDLSKLGVSRHKEAITVLRQNGGTPSDAMAIIEHFRQHSGAWGAGALYNRLLEWSPATKACEGWPKPSPKFERAEKIARYGADRDTRIHTQKLETAHMFAIKKLRDKLNASVGGDARSLVYGDDPRLVGELLKMGLSSAEVDEICEKKGIARKGKP